MQYAEIQSNNQAVAHGLSAAEATSAASTPKRPALTLVEAGDEIEKVMSMTGTSTAAMLQSLPWRQGKQMSN